MRTSTDVFHPRPKNLDQRKSCMLWRCQKFICIPLNRKIRFGTHKGLIKLTVFRLKLADSFGVFGNLTETANIKLRSAGQFNYEESRVFIVAYFNNNLNRLQVACTCVNVKNLGYKLVLMTDYTSKPSSTFCVPRQRQFYALLPLPSVAFFLPPRVWEILGVT